MDYVPNVQTAAIKWGKTKEEIAIREYQNLMQKHNPGFVVRQSGLVINPAYPTLGATPDGVTECPCCDKGLLEVKCPYKHVNTSPCEVKDKGFYLKSHSCGSVSFKDVKLCTNSLIRSSKYYYQVQGQIAICEAGHCDFVCWTPKGLHIERVLRDQPFIEEMLQKLNLFFMNVILPELMARRLKDRDQNNNTIDIICVCGKAENYDDMIACKSGHCKVEWYHLKCVGLKKVPQKTWSCLTCRKMPAAKRSKK